MSYSRRFPWGRPYLLTDVKDGVFVDEPAVFIGKKDSDMERPTVCAVWRTAGIYRLLLILFLRSKRTRNRYDDRKRLHKGQDRREGGGD